MTMRALCIGINNYPGTNMDLAGCVNDANDWADELIPGLYRHQVARCAGNESGDGRGFHIDYWWGEQR